MSIMSVPIRVNEDLRPSRLVRSITSYVRKSVLTVFRILVIYRPFQFFMKTGIVLLLAGIALGVRFLVYYVQGQGTGHVQSLILTAVLLIMGFQTCLWAFIADLLSVNRRLLEELLEAKRTRRVDSNER
jgi:hypothetical protein